MSTESDFYRQHVNPDLDRRLLHHALLAGQVAQIESRNFPDLERDAVPSFRRLNFNMGLLLSTYPAGATVLREDHSGGSHVAIRSGAVTVTSLTRSHFPRSITPQPYQETLAAPPQAEFWPPADPNPVEDKLWGLLFYGGPHRSPRLRFCKMTFPDPKGHFAPGTIDLIATYPEVVAQFDDEEYVQRRVLAFLESRRLRRA